MDIETADGGDRCLPRSIEHSWRRRLGDGQLRDGPPNRPLQRQDQGLRVPRLPQAPHLAAGLRAALALPSAEEVVPAEVLGLVGAGYPEAVGVAPDVEDEEVQVELLARDGRKPDLPVRGRAAEILVREEAHTAA